MKTYKPNQQLISRNQNRIAYSVIRSTRTTVTLKRTADGRIAEYNRGAVKNALKTA